MASRQRKKKGGGGCGDIKYNCIAFKWKTETIYLPQVVISSDLRRLADAAHVNHSRLEVKEPRETNELSRTRKGSEGEGSQASSKTAEKGRDGADRPTEKSKRDKWLNLGLDSSNDTSIPSSSKTSKESVNDKGKSTLLMQKFNNRKELFKNLMENMSDKPSSLPLTCKKCGKDYKDEASHKSDCSGGRDVLAFQRTTRQFGAASTSSELTCLECGKTFQKRIHLTLHQKIHASMDKPAIRSTVKYFNCNYCDRNFERNDDLFSHYQRQHNITSNYRVHQLSSSSEKRITPSSEPKETVTSENYECEKCGRNYSTRNQINIHRRLCKATAYNGVSSNEEQELSEDKSGSPDEDEDSFKILNVVSLKNTEVEKPFAEELELPSTVSKPLLEENRVQNDLMPYECSDCGRRFRFQHYLNFHERSHSKICGDCGGRIYSSDFLPHSKCCSGKASENQETGSPNFPCDTCGSAFGSNFLLSKHRLVHSFSSETFVNIDSLDFQSRLPFGCPSVECTSRFSHSDDLDHHINQMHFSENFGSCEKCERTFCSVFNLMRHRSSAHGLDRPQKYIIKTDSSEILEVQPTYYYIQKGYRHNLPPSPYVLISEEDKFAADNAIEKKATKIRRRRRREDVPMQNVYTCHICQKKIENRRYYFVHLAQHRSSEKHKCTICDKGFPNEKMLQSHQTRHKFGRGTGRGRRISSIPYQKQYNCEQCNKTFTDRRPYIIHVWTHKREDQYKCTKCDRGFLSETLLQEHIKRHDDPGYIAGRRGRLRADIPVMSVYTCNSCDKTFTQSQRTLYIIHLNHHKNSCTICGKIFPTNSQLKQHMKRHDDPNYKPGPRYRTDVPFQDVYDCTICNETFTKSERTQYLLHLNEHKYHCETCDKGFQSNALFQQHLQRHKDPNYSPGRRYRYRSDVPFQDSYTCETCDETFTKSQRTQYLLHLNEHKYHCEMCDRGFPSNALFQQHIERHKDPNYTPGGRFRSDVPIQDTYTCEICNETFTKSQRTQYLQHLKEHKYTCNICDRRFQSDNLLQQHIKRHDDPNYVPGQRGAGRFRHDIPISDTYTCSTCDKTFTGDERRDFMIHLSNHKREEKFKCPICDRKHLTEALLQQHLKRHEDPNYVPGQRRYRMDIPFQKMYSCETCDKKFDDRRLYLLHLNQHKEKEFKCRLCDKRFQSRMTYEDHVESHMDPSFTPDSPDPGTRASSIPFQENYTCEICQKDFAERKAYIVHLNNHKRMKKHTCSLCPLRFQSKLLLEAHMKRHEDPSYKPRQRVHHKIPKQDIYTCSFCQKQYGKRNAFITHLWQHKRQEKHGCHLCERKFITGELLQKHLRSHFDPAFRSRARFGRPTGVGKRRLDIPYQEVYTCVQCENKSFTDRIKYLMHLRNHSLEEKFQCPHCPRKYKTNTLLKLHMDAHNEAKTYKCDDCLKLFRTYHVLYNHRIKYCKKVPCKFQCSVCDDRFHDTIQLTKHFEKRHSDKNNGVEKSSIDEAEHATSIPTFELSRDIFNQTCEVDGEMRNKLLSSFNTSSPSTSKATSARYASEGAEHDTNCDDSFEVDQNNSGDDQDDDVNDPDFDISEMLATDFCETELNEPSPPSTPVQQPEQRPPKQLHSKGICYCSYRIKGIKFESKFKSMCHTRRCTCIQANRRCSKKCQCCKEKCLNNNDREKEQQQMFKVGRENMLIEDQEQQVSPDSNISNEDEDGMEAPMIVGTSSLAPITVGTVDNNQPSFSKAYTNVLSSELITIDEDSNQEFINEADDDDPLAESEPILEIPAQSTSQSQVRSDVIMVSNPPNMSTPPQVSTTPPINVSATPNIAAALTSFSRNSSLKCQYCKKIFKTIPSFISHFFIHGGEIGAYACPVCAKEYPFLSDYIQHVNYHNKWLDLDCSKCKSKFKTQEDMDKHLLVHHYKPMECGMCRTKYPDSHVLMAHWSKEHPTCQCGLCLVKFFALDDLTFHMKALHTPFDCVHCAERFEKIDPLLDHFLKHHYIHLTRTKGLSRSVPTPLSSLPSTSSAPQVMQAEPLRKTRYNLKCDNCGLLFDDHESLNIHLATHLPEVPTLGKRLQCSKCNDVFPNEMELHDHLSRHIMGTLPSSGVGQEIVCQGIGIEDLVKMVRTRINPAEGVAPKIYVGVKSGGDYMVQQLQEQDDVNVNLDAVEVLTCNKCTKTCSTRMSWMVHLRSHGLPLCSACGLLFDTREELLQHLKPTTGTPCVVFECHVCLKNYISKHLLRQHIHQCHGSEAVSGNTALFPRREIVHVDNFRNFETSESVPIIVASTSFTMKQEELIPVSQYEKRQNEKVIEEITLDSDSD